MPPITVADANRPSIAILAINSALLPAKVRLRLYPSENIVDTHFVALSRQRNSSLLLTTEDLDANCYFRSIRSHLAALDLCDGLVIFIQINFGGKTKTPFLTDTLSALSARHYNAQLEHGVPHRTAAQTP